MLPCPGMGLGGPGAIGPAVAGAGVCAGRGVAGSSPEDGGGVGGKAGSGSKEAIGVEMAAWQCAKDRH